MQDLYTENYKTSLKEIERLNIVKITILPKVVYRFNTIPIKTPAAIFAEIDKVILKFT